MEAKRAPVRRNLIDMLESAIAAEKRAAVLREIHGSGAERVCDALIAGDRDNVFQIEHLKDVRRALRWGSCPRWWCSWAVAEPLAERALTRRRSERAA